MNNTQEIMLPTSGDKKKYKGDFLRMYRKSMVLEDEEIKSEKDVNIKKVEPFTEDQKV